MPTASAAVGSTDAAAPVTMAGRSAATVATIVVMSPSVTPTSDNAVARCSATRSKASSVMLIGAYRSCPELAWGASTVLDPGAGARPVLVHRSDDEGHTVVALHHLGDQDVEATLKLPDLAGRTLSDVLDPASEPVTIPEDGTTVVRLAPYGCRWLRTGEIE